MAANDGPSRKPTDKDESIRGALIPDANVSIKNVVLVDSGKEAASEEQEVERKKLQ